MTRFGYTLSSEEHPPGDLVSNGRRAEESGAGYDHLYFHQIGPDQEGFFRFRDDELGPALKDLT